MVDAFQIEVPEEHSSMPLLKGRATVDMKVKIKDNPNIQDCVFRIVLDGYKAPVTAGNFLDLVERHFYDGMEIQRGRIAGSLDHFPITAPISSQFRDLCKRVKQKMAEKEQ